MIALVLLLALLLVLQLHQNAQAGRLCGVLGHVEDVRLQANIWCIFHHNLENVMPLISGHPGSRMFSTI